MIYSRQEASPGKMNPVPRPALFIPQDGAVVSKKDMTIVWIPNKYDKYYVFELAKDRDFEFVVDQRRLKAPIYRAAEALEEGTYYYRAKAFDINGLESAYSTVRRITGKFWEKFTGSIELLPSEKILKLKPIQQRKDTKLLCLDGCDSEQHVNPQMAWDSSQPAPTPFDLIFRNRNHGLGNCARASIAMMVSGYGRNLSQDRIAYYTEESRPGVGDGQPEWDLAHFAGMDFDRTNGGESSLALEWALNTTGTYRENTYDEGPPETGTPTFAEIKSWLYQNRPIMARMPFAGLPFGHVFVINGYGVDSNGDHALYILDPLKMNLLPVGGLQSYASMVQAISGIWVGPASAPNARNDESSIAIDTDGDGIMDFDELNRFHTDFKLPDTDGDGFSDKDDIRKYVFDSSGNYNTTSPDVDGDGQRRELDPDE
jgi:hypothetical protein